MLTNGETYSAYRDVIARLLPCQGNDTGVDAYISDHSRNTLTVSTQKETIKQLNLAVDHVDQSLLYCEQRREVELSLIKDLLRLDGIAEAGKTYLSTQAYYLDDRETFERWQAAPARWRDYNLSKVSNLTEVTDALRTLISQAAQTVDDWTAEALANGDGRSPIPREEAYKELLTKRAEALESKLKEDLQLECSHTSDASAAYVNLFGSVGNALETNYWYRRFAHLASKPTAMLVQVRSSSFQQDPGLDKAADNLVTLLAKRAWLEKECKGLSSTQIAYLVGRETLPLHQRRFFDLAVPAGILTGSYPQYGVPDGNGKLALLLVGMAVYGDRVEIQTIPHSSQEQAVWVRGDGRTDEYNPQLKQDIMVLLGMKDTTYKQLTNVARDRSTKAPAGWRRVVALFNGYTFNAQTLRWEPDSQATTA